jgi:hypothetical protein
VPDFEDDDKRSVSDRPPSKHGWWSGLATVYQVTIIAALIAAVSGIVAAAIPALIATTPSNPVSVTGLTPSAKASVPSPEPSKGAATHKETVGGVTATWTDYVQAGGRIGPDIRAYTSVQVSCKVLGFKVTDGDRWWYRISSPPWNGRYYASADAFYNNGKTSGSLIGSKLVDPQVPSCQRSR